MRVGGMPDDYYHLTWACPGMLQLFIYKDLRSKTNRSGKVQSLVVFLMREKIQAV